MKTWFVGAIALAAISTVTVAYANDRKVMVPIEAGMAAAKDAKHPLGDDIKFYFGSQKTPPVEKRLFSSQTTQKTNAFAKSDETACSWAFVSVLLELQKHARQLGANAVVNIVSNHDNVPYSSETDFECHAGAMVAGVTLKGDFVRINK